MHKQNVEKRENYVAFSLLIVKKHTHFFKYRDDGQMTEMLVSGTEVFSDAKMTETPYELRRVDMYANVNYVT